MNSSSRFSTFEIFRIIVPGLYCITLAMLLVTAFEIPNGFIDSPGTMTVLFITASVVAGLSFYSKETSKKRKAFLSNQPSTFILERSRRISAQRPLTSDEARRLYFYILNHHMPLTIHDKIFFFGMIYHIMVNIRRTSFWFGLAGTAGLILQIVLTRYMTPMSAAAVLAIWFVYFLNVRYNKADRKMQENYIDQIFWLEMNTDVVDRLILMRIQTDSDHA
jgi:hypothetical protein